MHTPVQLTDLALGHEQGLAVDAREAHSFGILIIIIDDCPNIKKRRTTATL
jgi:hypothetical protein